MMQELEEAEAEVVGEALSDATVDGKTYLKTSDNFLFEKTKEEGVFGAYVGQLQSDGTIDATVENPFEAVEDE